MSKTSYQQNTSQSELTDGRKYYAISLDRTQTYIVGDGNNYSLLMVPGVQLGTVAMLWRSHVVLSTTKVEYTLPNGSIMTLELSSVVS